MTTTPDLVATATEPAPPLRAWAPLAAYAALTAVLAYVVLALVRPPGPLDQPDPARQRDGLLLEGPAVPQSVAGVRFGDRPVVLLFERQAPRAEDLRAWTRSLPAEADVRLVLPAPTQALLPVMVVSDPAGALAAAVGLPTPVDGGRGVGYAVVDAQRVVRYRTLDPSWPGNGFEVATITGAVA